MFLQSEKYSNRGIILETEENEKTGKYNQLCVICIYF